MPSPSILQRLNLDIKDNSIFFTAKLNLESFTSVDWSIKNQELYFNKNKDAKPQSVFLILHHNYN